MRFPGIRGLGRASLLILLLAATGVVVFAGFDGPPLRFLLDYGLPPGKGRTGKTLDVAGIPFLQIGLGYYHERWRSDEEHDNPAWKLIGCLAVLGPLSPVRLPRHWTEVPKPFFVVARPVTNREFEQEFPDRERVPPTSGDDDPVLGVADWDGKRYAAAFARWLSFRSGRPVRLPTTPEREYARSLGIRCTELEGALLLVVSSGISKGAQSTATAR